MELQQLNKFLLPSHLLWLGAGLQIFAALVSWFAAEAVADRVAGLQVAPWPVLRARAAPALYTEAAPVSHLRRSVPQRDGFPASAMIERDAA
jgi:hypothetical protein